MVSLCSVTAYGFSSGSSLIDTSNLLIPKRFATSKIDDLVAPGLAVAPKV